MLNATYVSEAEERMTQHQHAAVQAKEEIARAFQDLEVAQNHLIESKLDQAIFAQRKVEEEALMFTKSVNTLYQRAAKWKAEQKRFRACLEGLDRFEAWSIATESDLKQIAGNLEYVCAVLEKEREQTR